MVGMVVVFLYHDRTQSLLCHMALNPLDAAGRSVVIGHAAYFASPISVLWILIGLFHFSAKPFVFLPPI